VKLTVSTDTHHCGPQRTQLKRLCLQNRLISSLLNFELWEDNIKKLTLKGKSDSVDWTDAVEARDSCRAAVDTVTKRFVPYSVEKLMKLRTVSFTGSIKLCETSTSTSQSVRSTGVLEGV
jgi:hypothetical protein